MKRVLLAILAIGTFAAPMAAVTSAEAQVPRNGPLGDRDHDGIPNAFDTHNNNNNKGAWGDRDHDGIPNKYDRTDNRALRDRDHDGVPQAWDHNDHNPYVR
jgi:Ni/Co efflux regulator RcnB